MGFPHIVEPYNVRILPYDVLMADHPDSVARLLQDTLRADVEANRVRYELLKTTEAKRQYLLALKKLSDMSCWRIGG